MDAIEKLKPFEAVLGKASMEFQQVVYGIAFSLASKDTTIAVLQEKLIEANKSKDELFMENFQLKSQKS
jgi:hypothetical protein